MAAVAFSPTPRVMLIQSAKLSPTVVHRILMIQNQMVTSGTLFNIWRPRRAEAVRLAVSVVMTRTVPADPCEDHVPRRPRRLSATYRVHPRGLRAGTHDVHRGEAVVVAVVV